jgi:oligopeptide/dipeptide ABC transporter ATP-binding protein
MPESFVQVEEVVKYYPVFRRGIILKQKVGTVHAVDGVSFAIAKGETLGLVGESGCGKSTTAKVILGIEMADGGKVMVGGKDVHEALVGMDRDEVRRFRRLMQMIFQNPYASLDPRMTVYDIISEPFLIHRHLPRKEWEEQVYKLLSMVGLEEYHAERYPHEFSGGQRQRICIARALAVDPQFIVADEPVSSLDVSIRAQVLNLLTTLQKEKNLTYLYISHDLSSVRQVAHYVAVMYLGKIFEYAKSSELFEKPLNPYTQALVAAVPIPDPRTKRERIILPGDVPSAINPPAGCRFHPRCKYATEICKKEEPPLVQNLVKGHFVACHHADKFV